MEQSFSRFGDTGDAFDRTANSLTIEADAETRAAERDMELSLRDEATTQIGRAAEQRTLELTTEQKLGFLKNLVERGNRSELVEFAVQRQGFKNFSDALVKLDVEDGRLFEGANGQLNALVPEQESKRGWWASKSRFVNERLKDVKRGGLTLAAVAGIAALGAPISLIGAAGAILGGIAGKAIVSYFARERAMYGGRKNGEMSLADRAAQDLASHLANAQQVARDAVESLEEREGRTLTPEQREQAIGQAFNTLVGNIHRSKLGSVQNFWKADKRARIWEMGGAIAGSLAGGIAAHGLEALYNAGHDGVWMQNGHVVQADTPNAHFVKWLDIQNGGAYPDGSVAQSGFHFQVQQPDLDRALDLQQQGFFGDHSFSDYYHGVNEAVHTPGKIDQVFFDGLQQNGVDLFHKLGYDPSGAILADGLRNASGAILAWPALIGAGEGAMAFREASKRNQQVRTAEGQLSQMYDPRYVPPPAPSIFATETRETPPVTEAPAGVAPTPVTPPTPDTPTASADSGEGIAEAAEPTPGVVSSPTGETPPEPDSIPARTDSSGGPTSEPHAAPIQARENQTSPTQIEPKKTKSTKSEGNKDDVEKVRQQFPADAPRFDAIDSEMDRWYRTVQEGEKPLVILASNYRFPEDTAALKGDIQAKQQQRGSSKALVIIAASEKWYPANGAAVRQEIADASGIPIEDIVFTPESTAQTGAKKYLTNVSKYTAGRAAEWSDNARPIAYETARGPRQAKNVHKAPAVGTQEQEES